LTSRGGIWTSLLKILDLLMGRIDIFASSSVSRIGKTALLTGTTISRKPLKD
jgi:hypothetical protein